MTVERDGSALTLPVLDGPSPSPPPSLPRPGRTHPTPPDPPPVWRVVRDVLGRRTEAEIDHGARLDLRGDADAFEVRLGLEAREDDELRWTRGWRRRIPRHLT
jgi:hypothetical protein